MTPGPFPEIFLEDVGLGLPTKMGVASYIWLWPVNLGVLYTMKLWRHCKKYQSHLIIEKCKTSDSSVLSRYRGAGAPLEKSFLWGAKAVLGR